jgi:cytidine deaminase
MDERNTAETTTLGSGEIPSQTALLTLVERARQAAGAAYAPYSRFRVGAAVLASDGSVYTGCNIENASYGLTICAERCAIWKAVSDGKREIVALAVFTPTHSITPPCGACRQVAYEFGPAMAVICGSDDGTRIHALADLLPGAFGPSDLGR